MSKSTATRANIHDRPVSPHLFIYRPIPTMVMSILHRITGGALYFGTLLVVWWLVASATSREQFDIAAWFFNSWIGLLILLGYTWALLHHMLGGIRHLVWDTGTAMGKQTSTRLAWANLAGSILLTVIVWVIAIAVRGGL